MDTLADKLQPEAKPKRKVLIIIDADPRTNPRAAEAVRLAGGVCVWEQVEVDLVLHGAAAHAQSGTPAQLPDHRMFQQFLPMIREKEGRVYLMPDAEAMETLEADHILKHHLKEPDLARLTAEADYVLRF